MKTFESTLADIRSRAELQSSALLAFSGGKDSCVLAHLLARYFKKLECVFFYLVDGLSFEEEAIDWVQKTYGATVHRYPYTDTFHAKRFGLYCVPQPKLAVPKPNELYQVVCNDLGYSDFATGCKRSDYWGRKLLIDNGHQFGWHPLKDWTQYHVLAYMEMNQIPRFQQDTEGRSFGIDLTRRCLKWMNEKHPDDFKKVYREFPFAEAVIFQEKWYGKAA